MRKPLLSALLLVSCLALKAQDYRFSQFYNAPLVLNPALTGKTDGMFRVAANFRNQWFNAADKPYITYGASVDGAIPVAKKDALGIGLLAVNDRTANGIYNNAVIMASIAYHKSLGKEAKHSLSLGLQGGYAQKSLDQNKLRFYNQFDGTDFNPAQSSGENNLASKSGYFDLQAGLMENSHFGKKVNFYAGFAMNHIIQPKEKLLSGSDYTLKRRYTVHAGLEWQITKVVSLLPSLIYLNQANASELNLGTSLGFDCTHNVLLYAGGYFRITDKDNGKFGQADAVIAYFAFEMKPVRLGVSYDVTVSPLVHTPKPTGSFELSLIVTPARAKLAIPESLLFCPRF